MPGPSVHGVSISYPTCTAPSSYYFSVLVVYFNLRKPPDNRLKQSTLSAIYATIKLIKYLVMTCGFATFLSDNCCAIMFPKIKQIQQYQSQPKILKMVKTNCLNEANMSNNYFHNQIDNEEKLLVCHAQPRIFLGGQEGRFVVLFGF